MLSTPLPFSEKLTNTCVTAVATESSEPDQHDPVRCGQHQKDRRQRTVSEPPQHVHLRGMGVFVSLTLSRTTKALV